MYTHREIEDCQRKFREITNDYLREFRYITDRNAFGKEEYWTGLRRRHDLWWGDCEDLAIQVLNDAARAWVPLDLLKIHYCIIPDVGGHAVAECQGLVADCNQTETVRKDSLYYEWVSYRILSEKVPRAS